MPDTRTAPRRTQDDAARGTCTGAAPCNPWLDTPARYGRVSRALHWLTAALVLLQFTTLLAWWGFGENALTLALAKIGPHGSLGTLILLVVLVRAAWAWVSRRRPSQPAGLAGIAARAVHGGFYLLLLLIPAMALLRQYGHGRPISFYGMEILPGSGHEAAWMAAPADLLHGVLSWLLLALIGGHLAMALIHRLWLKDAVLARLTGSLR